MKAPSFELVSARHLEEVFELLEQFGDEACILAGGQTLLAGLNMRLSEPALLIDIGGIAELKGLSLHENALSVGALVTHSEIEESVLIARHAPLLRLAVTHIAHRAIRNRGTWGGSIAYADPAAEWPACALAQDAVMVVQGRTGQRRIAADEFFLGLYRTALRPEEILIATEMPVCVPGEWVAFEELARRHGDYAIVGLAVRAHLHERRISRVRLAYLGVGMTPVRVPLTEAAFEGRLLSSELIDRACAELSQELTGSLEPIADLTNSVAMKTRLAGVLLRRAMGRLVNQMGEIL
jgi:carbon-monoxide dehydrogenase medium subunit